MEKELKVLEVLFKGSGVSKSVIDNYKEGNVLKSCGNLSSLYDLSDEEKNKIKEVENEHKTHKVLHVIQGNYILGGVDQVEMTSYILIDTTENYEEDLAYLKEHRSIMALVINKQWGVEEFGSIVAEVNPISGGLSRKF